MFLKSLDIFGFKSFADRTHIEFADGITALLGPNGCGKSNVVDAVKWVLGEQGAKNMRAEKMEDVIFNGTMTRKPLNVAEVTLTISNEQGLLPLDLSEITIKRRLFRSGEGEYWINGTLAKLKDVRELFWDTGVGKAAYSVMEQGKIDQILSSKPEDRRYIFEEAAGITRFKVRRAEAERKLERTQENMRQVEGILGEVKRSYDSLKIQAEQTNHYRELKEKIFNLELDIQLLRLKTFVQNKENRTYDIQKAEKERNSLKAEIDEINSRLEQHLDEVNEMESKIVSLQKEIYGLAVEKNGKENQLKIHNERESELKQKINQLEGRKVTLEESIETLKDDADGQEASLHDLNKRLSEIAKNIASFEDNIKIASNRINDNDKLSAEYESQISNLDVERGKLKSELEEITDDIVTQLDSKLRDAGYSSASRQKAQESVEHVIGQLRVLVSGRKSIFEDFTKLHEPLESDVQKFGANAVSSFTELEKLVQELENVFKGYAAKTPQFIDEFLSPEGIITKKRGIDRRIDDNRAQVQEKRDKIQSLKSDTTDLVKKIDEYRATLEDMRINQAQMKTQVSAAEEQMRLLRRQLSTQEAALHDLENEIYEETTRYDELKEQVLELEGEIASIERKGVKLTEDMIKLEANVKECNSDVIEKQEALKSKKDAMATYQSQIEKYNLELATAETEIRATKENFRETHSRDLMEFADRMEAITAAPGTLRYQLSTAKQAMNEVGSVNLMAPEEFAEAKERYDFLSTQLSDLQKACDDLVRITEEIRAESTEQFLATYNKIKKNFHNMFRRLFGGGRAELRLVDPQNVLESGIEIFAQPPGKKLENIALLSGGEKTMTAVSLLFATYMVRPSPFCLLDEIDAALDEQNVLRFVQTLREFGNVSQYIVITHNKKTVAGASTMLGVTMEESGVSKVITIKLEENGKIILPDPEPFEEEDVPLEKDVYIPPHPPKRNVGNLTRGLIVETAQKVEQETTSGLNLQDDVGTGQNAEHATENQSEQDTETKVVDQGETGSEGDTSNE
ncbi:MAG: AAA family ATPase [Treponemataceae bacterium]|nr:AAA family ATPase [Treponemataceae bacterium]